jgi:hypothetical protein
MVSAYTEIFHAYKDYLEDILSSDSDASIVYMTDYVVKKLRSNPTTKQNWLDYFEKEDKKVLYIEEIDNNVKLLKSNISGHVVMVVHLDKLLNGHYNRLAYDTANCLT